MRSQLSSAVRRLPAWLAAVGIVLALAAPAHASLRARLRGPAPVAVIPAAAVTTTAGGGCEPACCDPCVNICYRDLSRCRTCCDPCLPDIKTCVVVCDPCTGCPIRVPVCLPSCCTGDPCVSGRCTVVGRGLVRFTWCCGFTATVRFSRCGDLLVTYRG